VSVITREAVLAVLQSHAEELRSLGVARLGPFGSFARGCAGSGSDVDLLVEFAPGMKSFRCYVALATALEWWLGRPVELLTREGLSPHLGPQIMRELQDVPLVA
jgi:predicted nucleotidyltransferase